MISQVREEYKVKTEDLLPYYQVTIRMINLFEEFYVDYVPLYENISTDTLATLIATLILHAKSSKHIVIGSCELFCPKEILRQMKPIH